MLAPITAPLLCFAWTLFTSCCTADVVVTSAQFCVRWCLPVAAAQSRPAMKVLEQALGTVLKGHSGGKESLYSKQKHRSAFIYLKKNTKKIPFVCVKLVATKLLKAKVPSEWPHPRFYYARQRARKTNST